jgi:hypothetical protein
MLNSLQSMSDYFVEFEISSEDGFCRLERAFNALRVAKQSGEWRDDAYWLEFFTPEDKSKFWWPTPAEREDWQRRWFATPVEKRFTDPTLKTPWVFGSMIDAFKNGDYDLLECERISPNAGRLTFDPHAWPYGGVGCMKALVETFGHRVIAEPDL